MRAILQRLFVLLGVLAPAEVAALRDAPPGPVRLRGTLQCETPLSSPIKGLPCAGYLYRASAVGSGRSSTGVRMRTLRKATVYADRVFLELDDARVALELPPSDDFSADAHASLTALDLGGFRAVETTLREGQRVSVLGQVRRPDGAAPVRVRVKSIAIVDDSDR